MAERPAEISRHGQRAGEARERGRGVEHELVEPRGILADGLRAILLVSPAQPVDARRDRKGALLPIDLTADLRHRRAVDGETQEIATLLAADLPVEAHRDRAGDVGFNDRVARIADRSALQGVLVVGRDGALGEPRLIAAGGKTAARLVERFVERRLNEHRQEGGVGAGLAGADSDIERPGLRASR